jgi:predicted RNA-binding Zn ribbon-like protein
MSVASIELDERRRYGRVTPVDKIRGLVGSVVVYLVDLSLTGVRVAHKELLPKVGETCVVTFNWEGQRLTMRCEVRRTIVAKAATSQFEKTLFHTGLAIMSKDAIADRTLREIIETCVARAMDEQKANAKGLPAIAAQSIQTGKSDSLVRCELRGGEWVKTSTRDSTQPESGFTVSADETPDKVEMLCRAYARGDADGRKLIRTFAALSISKAEGIPTRRYAP